jgi:hypothetical protein
MARASPEADKSALSKRLTALARRLATLSDEDRRAVLEEASHEAVSPTLSWASVEAAAGIVTLGGDAVEDTAELYDG